MTRVVLILAMWLGVAGLTAAVGQEVHIQNLYDAFGTPVHGAQLDWGYSALIHFRGQTILFDAGANADIFGRNAKALGVDLKAIDYAVISHRHGDHYSGFDYVLKVNPALKIYVPEDLAFAGTQGLRIPGAPPEITNALPRDLRYFPGENRTTTGPWGSRFWNAHLENVPTSKEIAPGAFLIVTKSELWGDFNRVHPQDPPHLAGLPELSLALVTSKGTVLVTGCSHSGVENIVRETKQVIPKNVQLVTGGFHLLQSTAPEITQFAHTLKDQLGVRQVAPAHCTGMVAFYILSQVYGENFIKAGLASDIKIEP